MLLEVMAGVGFLASLGSSVIVSTGRLAGVTTGTFASPMVGDACVLVGASVDRVGDGVGLWEGRAVGSLAGAKVGLSVRKVSVLVGL